MNCHYKADSGDTGGILFPGMMSFFMVFPIGTPPCKVQHRRVSTVIRKILPGHFF
jgi:hypothetical protein